MVVFCICVSAIVIAIFSFSRVFAKVAFSIEVAVAAALTRIKAGDLVAVWWSVGAYFTTAA